MATRTCPGVSGAAAKVSRRRFSGGPSSRQTTALGIRRPALSGAAAPLGSAACADACPGPEEIPFGPFVTAVVIDSQWWLQQEGRPGVTSDCDCKTEEEVLLRLKDIVYRNRNKLLLFLSHHPFISDGVHGGYYTFKQHIFPLTDIKPSLYIPLPVIGSLYPLIRGGFGNLQDLKHPLYKNMSASIDSILSKHPNCIRIAGHEHGLQFLEKNGQQYVISGAGSKKTRLRNGPYSKFNAVHTGYATLELWGSGKDRIAI